jgi:endonuclease/exonuclease/phosphatase family metal-dependent hydrolase
LSVFVTHLTWRPDDSGKRQRQLREVLEFIRDRHRAFLPPILLGDLNAEPSSDELRMLTGRRAVPVPPLVFLDVWEQAGSGTAGHTWDRSNSYLTNEPWPSRRVDYILTGLPTAKPVNAWFVPLRCWLDGTTPIDDVQPSDHYAVVAELRCVVAPTGVPQQIETLGVDHVTR